MVISFIHKKVGLITLLSLSIIFIGYALYLGESILDPGDGLKHHLISKYTFQYPHLFFDHWGKPLFTLLSAPFAQFGFSGMLFFNIALFVITGILLLKIAKLLFLKQGWLGILFCFASPIYFSVVLSGLTEILFATLIILALYLFLKEQFFLGCLALSFSYFSRPESVFVIMWFVAYLVLIRKHKYIPVLGISIFLYSVAGSFYHDDIFWVFTKRPYSSTGTYGSGSLFHFIASYKHTFGTVISITFLLGIVLIFIDFIKKRFINVRFDLKWILLILFPIISVVSVHSILWWKGMQGSAGLLRILATITPLVALICLFALNKATIFLSKKHKLFNETNFLIGFLIAGFVMAYQTSSNLFINERMISSEEVLQEAADWYKKEGVDKKIYYMPPYFSYAAKLDPFGEHTNMEMFKRFGNKKVPSINMLNEELILWDGQFSNIEGKIPLSTLENSPNLVHVKTFSPKKPFTIYGEKYQVQIFRKAKNKQNLDAEVDALTKRIKKDEKWLEQVKLQAIERGVELDEMLRISANFIITNRTKK